MWNKCSVLLIAIIMSLVGHLPTNVQAQDEQVAAVFLNEGAGARATAMGEAAVALVDGSNMTFWNPGSLSFNHSIELMITHTEFIQGVRTEYFSLNLPISSKQVLGFNGYFSYINGLEKREDLNSQAGSFGVYDGYGTVAWGMAYMPNHSFGVALKGIYQQIDTYSAWSGALDFGYTVRSFYLTNLSLGATVRNLGLPIKFIETRYQLPLTFEIGAAYQVLNETLMLTGSIQKPLLQEMVFKLGAEYVLEDIIFLRAGYKYAQFGNDLGPLSGLSVGLGSQISEYKIDYSFIPYADLGNIHRLTIIFPFGKSTADEEKIMKSLERKLRSKQNRIINNYVLKGNRYFNKRNYNLAIEQYEKALVLKPNMPHVLQKRRQAAQLLKQRQINQYIQAGKSAYQLGEYVNALIEFNKAKELSGRSKAIRNWIKKAEKKLDQPQVVKQSSKTAQRLHKQGLKYLGEGRYQDAIATWKRLLKLAPSNKQVINNLNKTKKKLNEEVDALLDLADQQWSSDAKPEAVKNWRKVIKMTGYNREASARLKQNKDKINRLADDYYRSGVQNYVTNHLVDAIANWSYVLMLDPKNDKARKNLNRAKQKLAEIESLEALTTE